MTTCAACGRDESNPLPDRRAPTGRAFWVTRGARPMCSAHFPDLPDALVERLAPKAEDAPVLKTYSEREMKTLTAMFDDYLKLRRRVRQRFH